MRSRSPLLSSPTLTPKLRVRGDREMEGEESAAAAHQKRTKSLGGGRGGATTPVMVMEMVGILANASKVAESILDSGLV